jgi:hypothetical protein
MAMQKVISTVLCRSVFLETDGTATPRRVALDSSALAKLGP